MNKKYCVIGGQYQYYYYGSAPTLIGAKRLAGKHQEYWDNWQGWHIPDIYIVGMTLSLVIPFTVRGEGPNLVPSRFVSGYTGKTTPLTGVSRFRIV